MSWLKFEITTHDKPEVWAMAQALNLDPDAVVGKLLRVWAWFDQQTRDGNAPSVTRALLDRETSVTGFCAAMIAAGWMIEDGERISIPNFDRHNSQTAKTRAQTAKRVERKRSSNGASVTGSVTPALPEKSKSREEKNIFSLSQGDVNESTTSDAPIFPRGWGDLGRAALQRWADHRYAVTNKKLPTTTLENILMQKSQAGWSEQRFNEAVTASIAGNWNNIHHEDEIGGSKAGRKRSGIPDEDERKRIQDEAMKGIGQ